MKPLTLWGVDIAQCASPRALKARRRGLFRLQLSPSNQNLKSSAAKIYSFQSKSFRMGLWLPLAYLIQVREAVEGVAVAVRQVGEIIDLRAELFFTQAIGGKGREIGDA